MNSSHKAPAPLAPNPSPADRTPPSIRILLVDDCPEERQKSLEVLMRSGYTVDAVNDGAEAWAALQQTGYGLLVTDNNMPKVSGIELIQKLRAARMATPAILVSGAMPDEELKRSPWLQLAATLLKPVADDELLTKVKQALNWAASIPVTFAPESMRASER